MRDQFAITDDHSSRLRFCAALRSPRSEPYLCSLISDAIKSGGKKCLRWKIELRFYLSACERQVE
jgi:hypothetical protein